MFEIQWYANKQRKTIPLGKKYSEKTARDLLEVVNGKESRLVPIFPELKTELEALFFDTASEGKEYVINRYRNPKQNLGTMFGKVVRRAGLPEIPRPFDNMRMTRSNEVYNRWGAFKESQWIGHSARVRQDHYLMLTDDDFSEASKVSMELPAAAPQRRQGIRRKDMESAGR
jgi:integrase